MIGSKVAVLEQHVLLQYIVVSAKPNGDEEVSMNYDLDCTNFFFLSGHVFYQVQVHGNSQMGYIARRLGVRGVKGV